MRKEIKKTVCVLLIAPPRPPFPTSTPEINHKHRHPPSIPPLAQPPQRPGNWTSGCLATENWIFSK